MFDTITICVSPPGDPQAGQVFFFCSFEQQPKLQISNKMVSNCLLKSVNLIFPASSDIPQLMLLLLREAPRAQKVLLPGLVSIVIENQNNYFETTGNSSMPVDTTFSWSTEERPRSAASLSSLKRARGYSLEYARAHFFQFLLTFDACSLTSTTVSRHLWAKKVFL